jgi:hypothetical protein
MRTELQVDADALTRFLKKLLIRQIDQPAQKWLLDKLELLNRQPQPRDLFLMFSAIPRFIGKSNLDVTNDDKIRASELRKGFSLESWTVPQTARVLALCSFQFKDASAFLRLLDQIFSIAEVTELVALYSALPLLPYPDMLTTRASEGVRTNMSVVFDAVVLNNPYPYEYLDQPAWNQMVLKALFMERPLYKIYGLAERSNKELSKMIANFAHERWAAGRSTSPEMWRPIGNKGTEGIYKDLEKLVAMDHPDQQAAAMLAAKALNSEEAKSFMNHHSLIAADVLEHKVTWDDIGKRWWEQHN